ncbi:MAG: DUF3048 domain-containing protein [Ruminococcaceae bacterium]|nr:DUF3048 domain-containing protein [Oscillospiraceae bacterium]
MKDKKYGNLQRSIAAILIGVVLIFMIGIVASGWQEKQDTLPDGENSGDGGNTTVDADNPNGDTAGNDGTADNNTQIKDEATKIPEFINYLTGMGCTEDEYGRIPFAFTFESNAPLYGISTSSVTVEIPTENGSTRFLVFSSDALTLGKIGAVSPTRDYILGISKFFSGITVAHGNDDIISYGGTSDLCIDLSAYKDKLYRENGSNVYLDGQILEELCRLESIDTEIYRSTSLPYSFVDFGKTVYGNTAAVRVALPYAEASETVLSYDTESCKYILSKGGKEKIDILNGSVAAYTNIFVLFSDTVTYETSAGTETVVEAEGRGTGYYVSMGKMIEIRWKTDKNGKLIFEDLNGNKLTVNRGSNYIAYYKSSESGTVVIE